jgi:hypothetical protein
MRYEIGYRYAFEGKNYEVVRYGSLAEVSAPHLQMSSPPSHYVVRDERGQEKRVSDWFISELGTEVTSP